MGYTGAVFERFFGSLAGGVLVVGTLLLWIALPLLRGLRDFGRKDL